MPLRSHVSSPAVYIRAGFILLPRVRFPLSRIGRSQTACDAPRKRVVTSFVGRPDLLAKRRADFVGCARFRPSIDELMKNSNPYASTVIRKCPKIGRLVQAGRGVVNSKKTGSRFQSSRHRAWRHRGKRAEREAASAQREGGVLARRVTNHKREEPCAA